MDTKTYEFEAYISSNMYIPSCAFYQVTPEENGKTTYKKFCCTCKKAFQCLYVPIIITCFIYLLKPSFEFFNLLFF